MKIFLIALMVSISAFASNGKSIEYKIGDQTFDSYLVRPKKEIKGKTPAILIIHDWMGLTDRTKEKAEYLAKLGYIAYAIDVFGKNVRPTNRDEASKNAGQYYGNRKLLRERILNAYTELLKQPGVSKNRIGAMGYCFGGTSVMEFARTGTDLKGVVSFHGGLDSPNIAEGKNIKARVLALHGAIDPFVSSENLAAWEKEMNENKIDWQIVKYGGAVHSFTDKSAGDDISKGAAYNAEADRKSWNEMQQFFSETFK